MKRYLDLQAIDLRLDIRLELEIERPGLVDITIGDLSVSGTMHDDAVIQTKLDLMNPFEMVISIKEGCRLRISKFTVDGISLIPQFDYLAEHAKSPTSYLDCEGTWTLRIDRPFYHWLHEVTGQGWLLT